MILARRVILVGDVRSGVTWWSTAHSKLLSHLLSTRRSRQDRRTPALRPRNASRPSGLDLYPCWWTSPCLLYLRLSCFVLWAALRHTIDGFLYLLTRYYNQPVLLPLLLLLRIGDSGVPLLLQSTAVANHDMVNDRHLVASGDNCNGLQTYWHYSWYPSVHERKRQNGHRKNLKLTIVLVKLNKKISRKADIAFEFWFSIIVIYNLLNQ